MTTIELAPQSIAQQIATIFDGLDVVESTRSEYKSHVWGFIDFLAGRPLTTESFLEYKRHLRTRADLGVSAKNKYLVPTRILLRELTRRGLLPTDITLNVQNFEQSILHRQDGLNEAEVERFIDHLHQLPRDRKAARLRTLACLLLLQGLRQVEVCRLDVADLDLVGHRALVRGKGRDDKEWIDLQPQTVQALRQYMKTAKVADGPLFPSWHHSGQYSRLTERHVRRMIRQAFDQLGIDKTTHGMRHYFTTTLLEEFGGDTGRVAQLTRHRGLQMLQVYDDRRLAKKDLPRVHNAFKKVTL
jgi:integrase